MNEWKRDLYNKYALSEVKFHQPLMRDNILDKIQGRIQLIQKYTVHFFFFISITTISILRLKKSKTKKYKAKKSINREKYSKITLLFKGVSKIFIFRLII